MNIFKNLTQKQCCEYLGYAVALLVIAYVTSQICKGQANIMQKILMGNTVKEGLTNNDNKPKPTDSKESLVQRNEQLRHELYLTGDDDKYKSDYEDIIINLEEWADLETIKIITDQKCCKGNVNQNAKVVKQVNDLKTFKDSLEKSMSYLDSK